MIHGLVLCLIDYLLKVIKGTWAGVVPYLLPAQGNKGYMDWCCALLTTSSR